MGEAFLHGQSGEYGTALAAQVRQGYTVATEAGIVEGTIPAKTAQTYTPSTTNQTITSGQYLNGTQTIQGSSNLIPANIKTGVNMFGVNGTFTADGTAIASDILSGKKAYVNGALVTGTLQPPKFASGTLLLNSASFAYNAYGTSGTAIAVNARKASVTGLNFKPTMIVIVANYVTNNTKITTTFIDYGDFAPDFPILASGLTSTSNVINYPIYLVGNATVTNTGFDLPVLLPTNVVANFTYYAFSQ